jgi:hypothetical protein
MAMYQRYTIFSGSDLKNKYLSSLLHWVLILSREGVLLVMPRKVALLSSTETELLGIIRSAFPGSPYLGDSLLTKLRLM